MNLGCDTLECKTEDIPDFEGGNIIISLILKEEQI